MKKISTLLAVVALSAAATNALADDTWTMPGTYNGWSLEKNVFENVNGTLTQVIPDLYSDFKIVKNSWGNEWCSNGSAVENNVAYVAPNGGNNIMMAGDNMHYINATVTLTLGENDSDPITILVSAEKVKKGDETWQIVGDDPLAWDFTSAPAFEEGEDGVWTLAYNGSISGSFKIAHNGAWANCYSTTGLVALNTTYTLQGPADPLDNMSPADGPWENPVFTINVGDEVTMTVTADNAANLANVAAGAINGPAVYYNMQGQRVANPKGGIFIRVQNGETSKIVL
jgi:hypothetical protein